MKLECLDNLADLLKRFGRCVYGWICVFAREEVHNKYASVFIHPFTYVNHPSIGRWSRSTSG